MSDTYAAPPVREVPNAPQVQDHTPRLIQIVPPEAGAVSFDVGVQLRIANALERIAWMLENRP